MNLQQLRYLVAVVDEGSVSAAARAQHVSQPVISRSLRAFEREHRVTLFYRQAGRTRPTDAGLAVIAAARRALDALATVGDVARGAEPPAALSVAATPNTGALLSLALDAVATSLPGLQVRLCRAGEPAEVAAMVEARAADLGFGPLIDTSAPFGLTVVPLGSVETVVVSPEGSGLPDVLSWASLSGLPLALSAPTSARRRIIEDAMWAASKQTAVAAFVSDDRTSWITAAQAGIGSFFTYAPIARGLAGVEVHRFSGPLVVEVGFVHRHGPLPLVSARFVEAVAASAVFALPNGGARPENTAPGGTRSPIAASSTL